ncbi:uncharacterized protein LOC106167960 [Lingula anatina]|uniref:Structure-specific endonuclease subunit SLX4 n=1 Tax=Lingula anatina TaxID=7574 RepID=A0A1S3IW83_LINAN|nr:uncharacterized protein LOC106167960 [Lingula anatina]|eukprot:XP_013402323.1 uncharacterized protein LOC106167960 [Lingula anatina]
MIKEEDEDKQEDTPPLTQTAVVLAKLAAQSSSPINLPTSSQGFCEDPKEDQEEEEEEDHGPHLCRHLVKLQEDLGRLMGMVELSDITIRCSDGSLPGHCMMLAVRAPVMYKHVSHTEAGPVLDMSTFTTSAVSSVVRYLYTGVVDIALQVVPQVCDIAKRFHLQELMEACDQIMATDKKSGSSTSEDNIKKLLKEVWHEEDFNSKDGAVDQDDLRSNEDRSGTDAEEDNEEEADKEREEEEMEELYTIMATQRQRKMSGNLQNEKADDTDDSDLEEFLQGSLSSQNSSHAVSCDSSMDKNRVEIPAISPRSHDTFVGLTDEEVLSKMNKTPGTSSDYQNMMPIEEQEKKQLSFLNYDVNSDSGRDSIDSVLDSHSLQKKGQEEDFVLMDRMDEDSENHSKEEWTESVLTDNKHSGCDIENNALQDIRENSFDYDMILGSWDNEKDEHEKQKVDVEILDSDSGDDGVITNEGMLVVEPDSPKTSPSPKKTKNQLPFVFFGSPRKSLNSLTSPTRKNLSVMDSMRRADQSHANSNVKRTSSVTSPGKILKSQRTLFQKDLQCSQKLRKHGNKLISPVDKDRLTSENLDDIIDVHSDDEVSIDNILKNGDLKELNCGDAKIDKEIRSSSKKDNSPSAKPSRDSMYDRDQTESHTPLTTRRASAVSSCSLFSTPDMFADTQLTPQNGHTLTKVKNDPCSDKVLASPVNKEYERNPVVQDIKCSPLRKVGPITAVYSVKSSTKARSPCPKNLRGAKSVINNSLPSGTQKNVKTRKDDWTSKSTLQFSPSQMKLDFSSHSPTGKNNEKLAINVVTDQSLSPVVMSPSGGLRKSSYIVASPIESQHKDSTPPSSPPTPPLSPTFGTSEMGDALNKDSNTGNHFSFGIGHREDEEKTRPQVQTKNGTDNESDSNDEVEFVEESFVKDNDSPGAAPSIHGGSQPPLQDKTQPSLSAPSSGRYGQIPVPHNISPSKSTSPESLTITPFDSPNISPVFKRNSSLGSQKRKRSYSSDESIEEVDVNNDSLDDGDGNKKRKVDSVHDSDGAEVVESVDLSLDNPDPGVWDDFDDGGGFVDFPVSPSQQLGGSELVGYVRQEQERHTKNRDQSGGDVDEDDGDGDGDGDGYLSPPTFIETDEELDTVQQTSQPKKRQVVPLAETAPEKLPKEELEELGLDSFIWSEENEPLLDLAKQNADPKKETSTPVFQKKLKRPTVPSPFTPMPNYDDMVTPELKRAVQKYGVRPNMAKKRMRTLLTHIYKETHQYETDTDCEMSFHKEKPDDIVIPAKAVGPDSGDTSDGLPNIDATKEPKGGKRGPKGPGKTKQLMAGTKRKMAAPKKSTNKVEVNFSPDGTLSRQTQISATGAKSVVSESRTKAHEISSEEEESISTQEESEEERLEEALLEETIMPEEDEDITPSQQVSSADLHSKLMSFILSDKQLHSKILHYEPLELGDLQDAINAAGIRCGQQKLMEFLDEKCITFTMRKLQKGDRRKKQTKKKDKSVKSTQNNE